MKNKRGFKLKFKIFLIISLIFVFIIYSYLSSSSLIIESAGTKFESIITNCGYFAVDKCINENFDFSKVCKIERNEKGEIDYISTDTLLVNYLCKNLALDCYDYLNKEIAKGFDVPVGAFFGIKLFSGVGKTINVDFITIASTQCNFKRSFTSVGVNQTRQVLSVVIHTDIDLFMPFNDKNYQGDMEINLYDNLIVGKVPNVYLSNTTIGSSSSS